MFNFAITPSGTVSKEFLSLGIPDFSSACQYVTQLPYRRNKDKTDNHTVFIDQCGTCSTKHALLKNLAVENNQSAVKLMLAIFKMNAQNTPSIENILTEYKLPYIPEAHNYILIDKEVFDCTKPGFSVINFFSDIIHQTEISPGQITDFKVEHHKKFIRNWLKENTDIKITPEKIWAIREACIERLSA
jgi:hypothetical protein